MAEQTWSGVSGALLQRIDERRRRLDQLRPWPVSASERLWNGILPEWIAGSNAFDGNRLTFLETAQLLSEGGAFSDYSLREHLETLNHRNAIALVRRLARGNHALRASTVRRLHATLMAGIDDEIAGAYRTYSMERENGQGSVADLMRAWELWVAGSGQALHPVERAAVAHHRLLRIQPFMDGNGRTARLTMNLALLRAGYMPAVLRYEDRHDYREAIFRADSGGYAGLVELAARAVDRIEGMYLLALDV
jgi:Fic family protein